MATAAVSASILDHAATNEAAQRYTGNLMDRLDHHLTPSEVRVHVKDGVALTPEGVILLEKYQREAGKS